jgi:hypothetical protein
MFPSLILFRDGTISLEELANFLFPEVSNEEKPLEYEAGIVFEFTRSVRNHFKELLTNSHLFKFQALTKELGQYAGSEEQLFSEFAKIANVMAIVTVLIIITLLC